MVVPRLVAAIAVVAGVSVASLGIRIPTPSIPVAQAVQATQATPEPGEILRLQRDLLLAMADLDDAVDDKEPDAIDAAVADVRAALAAIAAFPGEDDIVLDHVRQGADLADECIKPALALRDEYREGGDGSFEAGFDYGFACGDYGTWSGI